MRKISRRNAIGLLGTGLICAGFPKPFNITGKAGIDLADVRRNINFHFEELKVARAPFGTFHTGAGGVDLYSSCDIAIARSIMGEDLMGTLTDDERRQWIGCINSYQNGFDGSYSNRYGHSKLHANGMVIGALGILGGKQRYNVKLYDAFNTIEKVGPWLENIDWSKQWGSSHLFWGGIHCFSLSKSCSVGWLGYVFEWLNDNLDQNTGWWRKGTQYSDRHQPLGGSAHILPIYQHHSRTFPYPERVIDSVLDMQLANGRWLGREKDRMQVMHYLELDALYVLKYTMKFAPNYRNTDITKAVERYASLVEEYWESIGSGWKKLHPHRILSAVGNFGLLQHFLPGRFEDDIQWTDIFSDIELYNTKKVERD
ncbi:MAG: hypothetical protein RIG77_05640 [Cyclobacteriaceae bacterium]